MPYAGEPPLLLRVPKPKPFFKGLTVRLRTKSLLTGFGFTQYSASTLSTFFSAEDKTPLTRNPELP